MKAVSIPYNPLRWSMRPGFGFREITNRGMAKGISSELLPRRCVAYSLTEAAHALGISPATAKRHWAYARAWLLCEFQ